MKRFLVFLITLILFIGMYNFQIVHDAVYGFFGDVFYKKTDFGSAEKHYTNILKTLTGSTALEADTLYNLGNTLYRLGEKEKGTNRIRFWKDAVGSYTKSLSIRIDKETEENLAFVKDKLAKEEQKQENQKKKDEEKTNTWSEDKKEQTGSWTEQKENKGVGGDTQKQSETGSGGQGKGSEKEQGKSPANQPASGWGWSNGWNYNPIGGQNKDDSNSKLSDADKQDLKQYLEQLKNFEKQNGKLLNPEKSDGNGSISDQIRNFFGNDSFFQDVIPTNNGKKDW